MKARYTIWFLLWSVFATAQTTKDYAVMVQATVVQSPASISLKWLSDTASSVSGYTIYRKAPNDQLWGNPVASLPASTLTYTDLNVVEGTRYEYWVKRNYTVVGRKASGYLLAGINIQEVTSRGKLLVLVEQRYQQNLPDVLQELEMGIVADGWQVIEKTISPGITVPQVKDIIKTSYQQEQIKALLMVGNIPVPYSGDIYPDGHRPDHRGAWPADVYYGVMDETFWTDQTVDDDSAASVKQYNYPGDGKFDQDYIYDQTSVLQIGRITLDSMPAFSSIGNDMDLFRQYVNRLNRFKYGVFQPRFRAVIDDKLGVAGGEAFASFGWRDFTTLVGDSVVAGNYFSSIQQGSSLLNYVVGFGSYNSISGVGTTQQFVSDSSYSVFYSMLGSYLGDWDKSDVFLKAPLCGKGEGGLVSFWSGRPQWHLHTMGLGATIGEATQLTQNNIDGNHWTGENSGYYDNSFPTYVHIALMGDPSLRLVYPLPVKTVKAKTATDSLSVKITWGRSGENNTGYVVLRSQLLKGPYTQIGKVTDTSFVDMTPWNEKNYYMVRPVRLEQGPSGSYYNLALGKLDSAMARGIVGLQEEQALTFQLYPNPNNGSFTLETLRPARVTVVDMMGKVQLKIQVGAGLQNLHLPELVPGIYFVQVENDQAVGVQKILIE